MAVAVLRLLFGRRVPMSFGVPAVVAVFLTALVVPSVWGGMRALEFGRDTQLALAPGITEREKCAVDYHEDWAVNFTRWLRTRIPPNERFAWVGQGDPSCTQLPLLPRIRVPRRDRPAFTVYARNVPNSIRDRIRAERALPPARRTVQLYAPDMVLVRER